MGIFNNTITNVGRALLADVQAGAVFTPTRIVLGSGSMSSGTAVEEMTDVIAPVKSLAINKKTRSSDGKCVFGGVYTNADITEPFYFRELALYAKALYLSDDGSIKAEGEETLYCYGNAGTTADYMVAYSTSTVVERQMDLVVWVGNNVQVNLTVESGIFLTREEAVLNTEQKLSDKQRAQARDNIRAMEIPTRTSWMREFLWHASESSFSRDKVDLGYSWIAGEKQEKITSIDDFDFEIYVSGLNSFLYKSDFFIADEGTDGNHIWKATDIETGGMVFTFYIGNGQDPSTKEATNNTVFYVSSECKISFYYRYPKCEDAAVVTSINGIVPDATGNIQMTALPPEQAVMFVPQELDNVQKRQARRNIGAVSIEEVREQLAAEITPDIVARVLGALESGIVFEDDSNAGSYYLVSVKDGKLQMTKKVV